MNDRQPTYPGRVELTDVETGEKKKYDMVMADEPTEPGTPPTKANLLQDRTEEALFGSAANRTVDQAFYDLSLMIQLIKENAAIVNVTVVDSGGVPISGAVVSGMLTSDGDTATTDDSGFVSGIVSEGSATLTISGYVDLYDTSEQFYADKGQTYNKTITVERRNFFQIPSSGYYMFSSAILETEVTCVGGGAGGSSGKLADDNATQAVSPGCSGGTGGGMGQCVVSKFTPEPNVKYLATIGAGGTGAPEFSISDPQGVYERNPVPGGAGGRTSFGSIQANGGSPNAGGTCDFAGLVQGYTTLQNGRDGAPGTVYGNISYNETALFGGSGGGGSCACGAASSQNPYSSSGGNPYGGSGGASGKAAGNATGYGGGGGGSYSKADHDYLSTTKAGNGGPGYISCKNFYKS